LPSGELGIAVDKDDSDTIIEGNRLGGRPRNRW
jgi:hypothetical protein